jgi:8-oxo-dGTP pyrophosphatase MutT (NUDIX family)
MTERIDIHKASGIIIADRALLVSRSKHKTVFIAPGGKLEVGETPVAALIRELYEEQGIVVTPQDIEYFGTFYAVAAGHEAEDLQLRVDAYRVKSYAGVLTPQAEIAENRWITSKYLEQDIEVASIVAHDFVPKLAAEGLID